MKHNPYSSSKLIVTKCPYRFRRQYIDKDIGDTSSEASKKGNIVHECYEELIRDMADGNQPDPTEIPKLVTKKIIKFGLTDDELIKKCHLSVMNILTLRFPVPIANLVDTEEMMAVKQDHTGSWITCDWDDKDAYFRGKIDVLYIDKEGYGVYVDHKTQMNIESDSGTTQMRQYGFLVMRSYPQLKGVRAIIHYADPSLNFMAKAVTFTKEDVREAEADIRNQIDVIEGREDFDESITGAQCNYCSLKDSCPTLNNLPPSKKVIVSAQEASEAAGAIYALEILLKDKKKQLQNFCKQYEVQVTKDGIITGFMPSTGWAVEGNETKKKLMGVLEKDGLDPYDYVKIDVVALKKTAMFMKKEPIEEIRAHLTQTRKTSFRSKKL